MLPTTLRLRPACRLLAALLTLCVLLSTLGWAHPACALPATHDGSATAARSGATPPADDGLPCHRGTQETSTGQPGEGQREVAGTVPCTLTTQCTTVVVVTAVAVPNAPARPSPRPAARGEAPPPGPAHQPDSPPPKR